MNQRDLEYFIKVVDAGSFSQAAILLGRPQPALSRHIRDLETDLRVPLLYRNGRGVVLTEAGRRVYARATTILQEIELARNEAHALARGGIDEAAIGMPPSLGRRLAAPIAKSLYAAYPQISLRLVDAFNGHLLEWLADGRIDASILYATEASQRLSAEPLVSEPMHLVEAPGHAGHDRPVRAAELAAVPLLMPSRQHGLRQQVELWASRHGVTLQVRAECDALSSMLHLAQAGIGAMIMPAAAVWPEVERGTLRARPIVEPVLSRQLVLATPVNRPCAPELVRIIKREVRALFDGQATGERRDEAVPPRSAVRMSGPQHIAA